MTKIHYRDGFKVTLTRILDASGHEIKRPDFDWTATFWTASRKLVYVASQKAGVMSNARFLANGRIEVAFNNHGLPPGKLNVEFVAELPDADFPGNLRRVVSSKRECDIELVKETTTFGDVEVECTIPIVIRTSLEAEAMAFGVVIDEINRQLMEMTGNAKPKPEPQQRKFTGPMVLQRGLISIYALPGVLYRNLGYIRIPLPKPAKDEDIVENVVGLSHVDMACVENAVIKGCDVGEAEVLLDMAAAQIRYKIPARKIKSASLRLTILPNTGPYIARDIDGLIRPLGVPFGIVEHARRETPQLERQCFCNEALNLKGIVRRLWSTTMDVEVKSRRGHRCRKKWRKARASCGGLERDRGVARVRFPRRGKKRASDWLVFSFKAVGAEGPTYVEPL